MFPPFSVLSVFSGFPMFSVLSMRPASALWVRSNPWLHHRDLAHSACPLRFLTFLTVGPVLEVQRLSLELVRVLFLPPKKTDRNADDCDDQDAPEAGAKYDPRVPRAPTLVLSQNGAVIIALIVLAA